MFVEDELYRFRSTPDEGLLLFCFLAVFRSCFRNRGSLALFISCKCVSPCAVLLVLALFTHDIILSASEQANKHHIYS